ncbi:hypothetical protein A3SI_11599 [Nitritalea halalkaliphila LW7]|uniref:Anti-sigma factor n=1 Tax=Nitritalea halalkaliphila LW7 TaxID=1189621 RepID=I5C2F3_9BACT|nr:anti-sigma factor [Nitritalea halalkaliphila]EIM76005.1 hypothetical protein A3SI_11599 [Nitritalea halalkaliphila LW7]
MDKELDKSGQRKLECADVSRCFQLLERIIDGNNIPDSKEIIQEKLAKCQPCFEHFHLEKAIKEAIHTKCTKFCMSEDMKSDIRKKIQEIKLDAR